ncbi:MAG: GntR family transcriptional regulator [Deltaproteobacteria bacterium]|nr:GntR family transcriptional regulator [Deltaproteobacteria bacterium]
MDAAPPDSDKVRYSKPKSVVETVADYLRESIVAGDLKPEEKINNNEITKRLGVSSIPLREALRILESEGLVVSHPGRGHWVSKVSRKDLEEAFEMRTFLEVFGVDLLKKNIEKNPETKERLKKIDIRELAANLGPESCLLFHRKIIELAQNRKLIALYDIMLTYTRRYQRMDYTIRHGGNCCIEPHSAILEPLIEGNYEEAKEAIRTHLDDGRQKLLASIELSE